MDDTELLTTGKVARLLGSSRQHVVDLCDRGELPFVRAGTHRRIARSMVLRLLETAKATLTREQEQSLWLHLAVAGRLVTEPDLVMAKARANLDEWGTAHRRDGMSAHWLAEWKRLLDTGVDEVADVLCDPSDRAVELRQNSPFAGVLPPGTRARVLDSFKRHWRKTHDNRGAT